MQQESQSPVAPSQQRCVAIDAAPAGRTGVLFVCTGNICRSPLAEWIFRQLVEAQGVAGEFDIGSCGTGGWHTGDPADPRTLDIAKRYGIPMKHTARQFDPGRDYERFEWIMAMDRWHFQAMTLGAYGRPATSRIHMMRSFDPTLQGVTGTQLDVPDPYYGGEAGFDDMYHMLDRACRGLLAHMRAQSGR